MDATFEERKSQDKPRNRWQDTVRKIDLDSIMVSVLVYRARDPGSILGSDHIIFFSLEKLMMPLTGIITINGYFAILTIRKDVN